MLATMADAHREWHRNADVPMGVAGCPMDACDGSDPRPLIKCGHCRNYHRGIGQVQNCSGAFASDETCDHGMSLAHCCGPEHYGPED